MIAINPPHDDETVGTDSAEKLAVLAGIIYVRNILSYFHTQGIEIQVGVSGDERIVRPVHFKDAVTISERFWPRTSLWRSSKASKSSEDSSGRMLTPSATAPNVREAELKIVHLS